jgi:phosphoribosylamine--glycine ligase
VVAAAEGYPTAPRTGDVIEGLDAARADAGASVHCAGVAVDERGRLVTAGGRVLNVIGRGPDVPAARRVAYEALAHLSWPGLHHRTDIAGEAAT